MKNRIKKLAELATFIYAIMVFISLMIDNAFFSHFNIRIISYMSISEILLSCVEQWPIYLKNIGIVLSYCLILFICYTVLFEAKKDQIKKLLFTNAQTIQEQHQVALLFNWAAVILIPILLIFTPTYGAFAKLNYGIYFDWMSLFVLILVIIIPTIYCLFFKTFKSGLELLQLIEEKEKDKYTEIDKLDTDIYTKCIKVNYKYRWYILFLFFLIGFYYGQKVDQAYRAQKIITNGSKTHVIIDGDDMHIDTREGMITYISDCEKYIFLYDCAKQSSIIIDKSRLHRFVLLDQYDVITHKFYDDHIAEIQEHGSHVDPRLESVIDTLAKVPCDYTIDIPASFCLVKASNNHFIWRDSVTNVYIEQVNIPKDFTTGDDDIQWCSAGRIYRTDLYAMAYDNNTDEMLCRTIDRMYVGKCGEYIRTYDCEGAKSHAVWLFYDPSGRNRGMAVTIFDSVKIKGDIFDELHCICSSHPIYWGIMLGILAIGALIVFILNLLIGELDKETIKSVFKTSLIALCLLYIPPICINLFVRITLHKWALIAMLYGAYIACLYVLLVLAVLIHRGISRIFSKLESSVDESASPEDDDTQINNQ